MVEIGINYGQHQKQTQSQNMSPQQIHAIKLLQMNVLDLKAEIENELIENPVLEIGENYDSDMADHNPDDWNDELDGTKSDEELRKESEKEELNSDEIKMGEDFDKIVKNDIASDNTFDNDFLEGEFLKESYSAEDGEKNNYENYTSSTKTLNEFLSEQIGLYLKDEEEQIIAQVLIDNIDESGLLKVSLKDIRNNEKLKNIDFDEYDLVWIEDILKIVQTFDPIGCGSRNIREALMVQLEQAKRAHTLEYEILEKYYEDFKKKRIRNLVRKLDRPQEIIVESINDIRNLPFYPGSKHKFIEETSQYIIPDLILEYTSEGIIVVPNDGELPSLIVNDMYRDIASNRKRKMSDSERITKDYIKSKVQSANFLINAVMQRKRTLKRVMEAIIEYQKNYFENENGNLVPMKRQDIADIVGIHQATVSRVVNSKYVLTKNGNEELKSYFSTSLQKDGIEDGVSNTEVMNMIKEIIDEEDKKKPLSDEKIANIITVNGVKVARRTIAKYREQMNIQSTRGRKVLI